VVQKDGLLIYGIDEVNLFLRFGQSTEGLVIKFMYLATGIYEMDKINKKKKVMSHLV
jgi:hypothetical protein